MRDKQGKKKKKKNKSELRMKRLINNITLF